MHWEIQCNMSSENPGLLLEQDRERERVEDMIDKPVKLSIKIMQTQKKVT